MLDAREGQTYVCKRCDLEEWTLDKEYVDDDGDNLYLPNDNLLNEVFKLKENTVDLNKLTLEELDEYLQLATSLEEAEYLMNNFIERMTK